MDDAYLAGILDGEGSIVLEPYKGMWRISVNVDSTDRELLEWLKARYTGYIVTKKKYQDHHRQAWTWRVVNRPALAVLEAALPFMVIERKIARAKLLLEEWPKCTPRNGKYTPSLLETKYSLVQRFKDL